jgi:glycosyltransferase involved in cell wall biosynthesis
VLTLTLDTSLWDEYFLIEVCLARGHSFPLPCGEILHHKNCLNTECQFMKNTKYDHIKPLLYEPEKGGHRLVILRYVIEILRDNGISFFVIDEPIKSKQLVSELIEISKQENCNILHVLTFDGLFADFFRYSFRKINLKLPKIVGNYYLYNNLYESPKSWLFNYLFLRQSVDKLLISDEFIETRHYSKWKKDFISYIPDPWNTNDFKLYEKEYARKSLDLPTDKTLFLMFGELSFRKGINYFINALFDLDLNGIHSCTGVIAGQVSSEVKKSETYTKMLYLKNKSKLIIHDYFIPEDKVSMYFSSSNFIVCPYPKYFKVSSGTFTRACAAGVPSIVPDSSNLALIVDKIRAGYVFRSESLESLASVMKYLLSKDHSDSLNLSQSLQSFSNQNTVENYGKALLKTYLELTVLKF